MDISDLVKAHTSSSLKHNLLVDTSVQAPIEGEYGHFWSCGAHTQWPSHDRASHLLTKSKAPPGTIVNLEWIIGLLKPACKQYITCVLLYIYTESSQKN